MASAADPLSSSPTREVPRSALTPRERAFADAVAERVAHLLGSHQPTAGLVDASAVAARLGVSRDWVYAHADEMGGRRIGEGSRGRLRFDLDQVLHAWRSDTKSEEAQANKPAPLSPAVARAASIRTKRDPELLPVREGRKHR
jgi:hypothetical protein